MSESSAELALWYEVSRWLTLEARVLDERRFEHWLGFLAQDVRYVVRVRSLRRAGARYEDVPAVDQLPLIDEGRTGLETRVRQIGTLLASSEVPPSRTRHMVANIETEELNPGEIVVRSNCVVYRQRLEEVETFAGDRLDVLRRDGAKLSLSRREITLEGPVQVGRMCPIL